MLLLDKIDLFSVKAEKRRERIEEIFTERINDIHDAEQTFNNAAIETMRLQKLQFIEIEKKTPFKKALSRSLLHRPSPLLQSKNVSLSTNTRVS